MDKDSLNLNKLIEELEEKTNIDRTEDLNEESVAIVSTPIVRLINSIIRKGIKENSSDIHIEPIDDIIRIRLRVDGDLREIVNLPINHLSSIVTRIKIMAEMDISESRLAQDGRINTLIDGNKIDMRISTFPTVYGEKIVIRLLARENFNFTKESLGLHGKNLRRLRQLLNQPYGMILVTGPTGSGKTTSLYTILRKLNTIDKNIITIEDPVEYKLKGVNQVQVNEKSGLNFLNSLKSIFRQDPDIIMVGEIRDSDTAELAIKTSITGHLVFSTLHTNDGPSTIIRLLDMGIEPYLIRSSLIGIVSQRLVKLLCKNCNEKYKADISEKRLLKSNINQELLLYRPKGCNKCNQGYIGRTGIFEVMPITKDLVKIIDKKDINLIREQALKDGMTTLLDSAIELVKKGYTSFEEVERINLTL